MGPIPPAPIVTQMVPALARKKPPHLSKAVQKAKRKRDRKRDRRKEDKKQQILKPQPPPDPVLTEEDKAEMREALRGGVLDQFDW